MRAADRHQRRLQGAARVGAHKPSTLMDLEAGTPLELGALVGGVIEIADLTGVSVPALRAVAAATQLLAITQGVAEG
jgi:2-dehydropantoate 2-reductase